MKPHESPRINKKSIRGDSWPAWNRGIKYNLEDVYVGSLVQEMSFSRF